MVCCIISTKARHWILSTTIVLSMLPGTYPVVSPFARMHQAWRDHNRRRMASLLWNQPPRYPDALSRQNRGLRRHFAVMSSEEGRESDHYYLPDHATSKLNLHRSSSNVVANIPGLLFRAVIRG
ncbi:uncharacterized protein BJX67DRAFT_249954 [Aspergillus lucknowensis]|uniref:Secreted protein n=1 Tax=Aspergillus lucknowensis TaxID=176173 RepID=A0ABR4M2I7_9EURO